MLLKDYVEGLTKFLISLSIRLITQPEASHIS
jgi:hypothetical protein